MNPRPTLSWTTAILGVVAAGSLANAAWMLAAPLHWYETIPGVVDFGPFNVHFVRDIGCAYLATGLALAWAAVSPRFRFPLVAVTAAYHGAHAILHVYDTARGHVAAHHGWLDFPGVYLPALLLVAVSVSLYRSSGMGHCRGAEGHP